MTAIVHKTLFTLSKHTSQINKLRICLQSFGLTLIKITGGLRLVRILGPGKNRTSEIRTSGYYIANFH